MKKVTGLLLLLFCMSIGLSAQNKFVLKQNAKRMEQSIKLKKIISTPLHLYNLGRLYAKAGNKDKAILFIKRSIRKGWTRLDYMVADKDLKSLHNMDDWKKIVSKLEKSNREFESKYPDINLTLQEEIQGFAEYELTKMVELEKANYKGVTIEEYKTMVAKHDVVDMKHQKRMLAIIGEFGYPGKSMVGLEYTTLAKCLKTANTKTQEMLIPVFQEAALADELDWQLVAEVVDIYNLKKTKKQVYGTLAKKVKKGEKWEVYPMQDERTVNQRREEAGLEPIESFLKTQYNITYKSPSYN